MDNFLIFGLVSNISFWLLIIIGLAIGFSCYIHKIKQTYIENESIFLLDKGLYRTMLNMVSDCVILLSEDGTVLRVNKKLSEYYGGLADKIEGKNYQRFNTDFNYEEHKNNMKLNFDLGTTYTFSVNLYQSNRDVVPFDVEIHRFSYAEKNYYAVVAVDRKRLQERERYIEEQSNRLMEIEHIAGLGYWVLNQQTKEVAWSRELYEILGYEINNIKPNMDIVFAMVHPADQERVTKAFLGAFQNQQAVDIHHRIISIRNDTLDVIVRIRHRFSEKSEHLSTIGIVQNITEQKEMQEHLNYQSHFSKAIVDDSDLLVLITDEDDSIIDVNPYIETITGKTNQELVGVRAETIFGKFQHMPGKKSRSIVDKDGRTRWIYWNSRTLPYFDGRSVVVGVGLDVSEGAEYRQKFEYLAYHEPVTGMSSRLKLSEVLERYFEKNAGKAEKHMALLDISLTQYQHINRLYGSQIGDQLILQVCKKLYSKVGHYGLLARYGDDTLIMFLPNRNAQEKIELICQEILETLNTACQVEGKTFIMGGQIGIAKYPNDAESKDELMRFAEEAMNQAKENPAVDYYFFDEALRKKMLGDQRLFHQSGGEQ